MRPIALAFVLVALSAAALAQTLFVGLEDSSLVMRSTDLSGFPNVSYKDHYRFEVNGATAAPDGTVYLCNGPFTTKLYAARLDAPPQQIATVSVDIHGLAYGQGRLFGFSNFASPMGIYEIDIATGKATLQLDTSGPGFRFFGLDYNAADGLLYGYTEYGKGGLYSIDIATGTMVWLVGSPPNVNGQGRALAVGKNTVFLLSTRGDEGEPCFAYDVAQGIGGKWVAFTNPYPTHHNTGGAAWVPAPSAPGDLNCDGAVNFGDINPFVLALSDPALYAVTFPDCDVMNADINGDGEVNFGDINPFIDLLSGE